MQSSASVANIMTALQEFCFANACPVLGLQCPVSRIKVVLMVINDI